MFTPLNELAYHIHENAKDKGWWDDERMFPEIAALIHCEVSEAMEEYRNGHKPTEVYAKHSATDSVPCSPPCAPGLKPEGIPIELADVIIRILDYCGKTGIDIDDAIQRKIAYNKTRPHRHGGKVA